jgi:diguanylate cyclase (GGDEF)-like protein
MSTQDCSGTDQILLRKDDFIARVGGDEFAVILPGAGKDEALRIVERINKTFANHDPGGRPSLISISIGQSTVYDTETSLEDALNWADKDMYSRKQRSKVFPAD